MAVFRASERRGEEILGDDRLEAAEAVRKYLSNFKLRWEGDRVGRCSLERSPLYVGKGPAI